MTSLLKYVKRVGISLSVLVNVILGGEQAQTFSARNWEWKRNKRKNVVFLIDTLLGTGHCQLCWVYWRTRKW